MRTFSAVALLLCVCGLTGCFSSYEPEELYRTVSPWGDEPGVYQVDYYEPDMWDEYWQDLDGPYDPARYEGVSRYLEDKNLIPEECVNGIVVVDIAGGRTSIGSAFFHCRMM